MQIILTVIVLFFLTACSSIHTVEYAHIKQLSSLPQHAFAYTKHIQNSNILYTTQQNYKTAYFSAWRKNTKRASLYDIKWPFRNYTIFNSYGANLKPIKLSWFYHQYANANFPDFASVNKFAMTLKYSALHNFPTEDYIFYKPTLAGEGFPFDYNQNSGIDADKPVFVSFYSRDGAWAYVFTSFASGWISASNIAFISRKDIKTYQSSRFVHILKDSYPIKDKNNAFVCYSRIGMMLPLVASSKHNWTVSVALRDCNGSVIFKDAVIPKYIGTTKTLTFTKHNIDMISNAIMHSKYGWGGINGERDCSAFVRDFYAPFGIWLPRNSASQAKVGKIVSLQHLLDVNKIDMIKAKGIPFQTLLYMRGHILIYAGIYHNRVIALQEMWGIGIKKGKKTGRVIIGHAAYTTLNIGHKLKYYNAKKSILHKIISMNIITK